MSCREVCSAALVSPPPAPMPLGQSDSTKVKFSGENEREATQMKHTHYIRQSRLFCMYRNYVLGIRKYLAGRDVLEVGPNKGALFEKFYPETKSYMLLEPNKAFEKDYVRLKAKYSNLNYEIGGFETFAEAKNFDTIVMMAVISHIRMDPQKIFDKIDRLLKKGGHLIVETNNTKRNLGVFPLLDKNYRKLESKASYNGPMKWLKIDDRSVFIYQKA
jgi:2-polyprenyl-3-methyl-5-hydroxy-6-metoxy-1,4-benzoquinol methylase